MFRELSNSEMSQFVEGFVPFKSLLVDAAVKEAIRPKLAKLEAGESLRLEGKETMTGADLIANLAVTQHFLDRAPNFSIDQPDRDLMRIVADRPVNDFKPVKIFNTDEIGLFNETKEAEDYKADSFGDEYTQVAVKKYGKIIRLSWETLVSDTLGELGDLQTKLARAGKRTIFKNITDIFANAVSFFNVGNLNIGSGVLNEANLAALCAKVSQQKDAKGNPLWVKPRYLVVPVALENIAKKLVNPMYNVFPTSLDNMATKFDLEVIANPDLDSVSTTQYYVFADPNDMPAISHISLAGHKGIELLVKVSDQKAITGALNGELGSFKNDTIELKARFFGNDALRYPQAAAMSSGS